MTSRFNISVYTDRTISTCTLTPLAREEIKKFIEASEFLASLAEKARSGVDSEYLLESPYEFDSKSSANDFLFLQRAVVAHRVSQNSADLCGRITKGEYIKLSS